ncbi:MAG TPA: oligopeptide transporter, OPT family [bacterium]|nr:oligopeptide transporter, OPT family [bacterium]
MSDFKPFIPASQSPPDFNAKTVILGVILGALFGSANAYLGLRVGLTISTAIPLAVISVAILRLLTPIFGKPSILECNISQTAGSASSSLASGIIFTIPALFIWGYNVPLIQITLLAVCGAVLGIMFMIPLRGFLIVKEHRNLPYPEGTASAQVLIAADEGGATASGVFRGLGFGALYKGLISLLHLWPANIYFRMPLIPKAEMGISATPALLGVGYILGRRIGAIMVGGGLLSWMVLIPFIAWRFPEAVRGMSPSDIWDQYIRIIGAGAVASAGIITVIKSIPTMIHSLKIGVKELRASAEMMGQGKIRTERDLPIIYVLGGVSLIILMIAFVPGIIGTHTTFLMRLISGIAIACFAFCFVTVSSRIVGMIGVSSNPTSGMAIVTLLGVGIIFKLLGWTDLTGKITALTIGTVVCISASIAGDISQDLKSGYLLGATPWKQQISEVFGGVGSAFFVGLAVYYLGKAYGFGSAELPAPQAMLMKTVLDGVLDGNLNWSLVGIGALISVVVFLCKLPPLAFAVGVYLPLSTMTPVFLGGLLRHFTDRKRKPLSDKEKSKDQGLLLSSGLIAGEGLMGVVIAVIAVITTQAPKYLPIHYPAQWMGQLVSGLVFCLLGWILFRAATRKSA